MSRHPEYNQIIYEIYKDQEKGINLAKKYKVTPGYISQIKTKIKQLKYPPKIKNDEIICYKCEKNGFLEFHHNHSTNEMIAKS